MEQRATDAHRIDGTLIRLHQELLEENKRANASRCQEPESEATAKSKERTVAPQQRGSGSRDIAKRLEKKFGLGGSAETRYRLYQKIEAEVRKHGDPVLMIISDCVTEAQRARTPARWFCSSVTKRLKENGFLQPEQEPW